MYDEIVSIIAALGIFGTIGSLREIGKLEKKYNKLEQKAVIGSVVSRDINGDKYGDLIVQRKDGTQDTLYGQADCTYKTRKQILEQAVINAEQTLKSR